MRELTQIIRGSSWLLNTVLLVVKHSPILWFAPNAEEDNMAKVAIVKDDPETEKEIDAFIFIKAWCDPLEEEVSAKEKIIPENF